MKTDLKKKPDPGILPISMSLAIPYVAAIIERFHNGRLEVLMQTRWKPEKDPVYSGTLEFPAGTLDRQYESVYDALSREIFEETGLKLKRIKQDSRTNTISTDKDDAVFGFRPFCCTQQLKNGKPWVGFVFLCEVENEPSKPHSDESKDVQWMDVLEVKSIFQQSPEKLFTLELPAWEYYFQDN